MLKAILITIAIVAPLSALVTSYVEDRKQYNLWDWLKDKVKGIFGREVLHAQVTIKVARADLQKVEEAILGMPNRIKAAIRRRV
jgi:hypothetical protein